MNTIPTCTTPTPDKPLKRTPFYQYHVEHDGNMVDFAGWELPIMYGSIHEEHRRVRAAAGLFDVSHMGRFTLKGPGARRLLERVLTRSVTDMEDFSCRYSLVCNEQGGVLDDVVVYRYDEHWMLVVNACNRGKILKHLRAHAGDDVRIKDESSSTVMIALQGPQVIDRIAQFSREVPSLGRYRFCTKQILMMKMTISRTGYTGEDGVEVIMSTAAAGTAIRLISGQKSIGSLGLGEAGGSGAEGGAESEGDAAGLPGAGAGAVPGAGAGEGEIRPVGLGARDTLRLEAGMPLYGHELTEQIDPLTAGLDFAVNLDKDRSENGEGFIGQDALQKIRDTGITRKRVGLRLKSKRTARQGMEVRLGGDLVGQVTSACVSPTLGYPIAMAYVDVESVNDGDTLQIQIGSQIVNAQVVPLPFYKRSK